MTHEVSSVRRTRRTPFALRPIALAAVTLTLAACGGGGGSDTDPPPPPGPGPAPVVPQSISGTVVDGYLAGATVNCRKGGTLVATTTSNASGGYAFNLASGQTCDTIEASGGIDVGVTPDDPSDDVAPPHGLTRAPVPTGSAAVTGLVASPLATLVQTLIDAGSTPDAAQALVKTSLGLPAALDLLHTDPAGNAALYKANNVVAQLVHELVSALAAAGGVANATGRHALADASFDALAARLPGLSMAALTQSPDALTPTSPLFGLVEQAAANAKADPVVATALQGVNATTFAALASPLVSSATGSVNAATDIADVVARVNQIEDRDRAAAVLGALKGLVDNTAANPQAVLDDVAAALAAADGSGADQPMSLTVGGETLAATVAGGMSNYALLLGDQLTLHSPSGSTAVTLADFESPAGVTVPQELIRVSFSLEKSAANSQLSQTTPMEAPLALEVTDATRTFQAYIDRVSLTVDAGNKVVASLPAGARLWVYGKTATSETTSPLIVTLAGTGLQIVSTIGGTISYSFDRLFQVVDSAATAGSALDVLAANRVANGTFDVKMALGRLRTARATSPSDPTPALAALQAVTLRAGGQSVTGHGYKGKAVVTP
ncbi:MAG TPA: hypothetical protein VK052_03005 [Zeimonas sp.]|nr:hypothetical protein [Zeimonas sp.]